MKNTVKWDSGRKPNEKIHMLRQTLQGTGVALVTPFKKDKSIDFEALENLIDIQIAGGIDYVVSLGTTGESVVLSFEEKLAVLDCT